MPETQGSLDQYKIDESPQERAVSIVAIGVPEEDETRYGKRVFLPLDLTDGTDRMSVRLWLPPQKVATSSSNLYKFLMMCGVKRLSEVKVGMKVKVYKHQGKFWRLDLR